MSKAKINLTKRRTKIYNDRFLQNKDKTFDKEHYHVGGKIYQSDFNTDYRGKDNMNGSTIASRIATDFQWEKKILRNLERNKKYGN